MIIILPVLRRRAAKKTTPKRLKSSVASDAGAHTQQHADSGLRVTFLYRGES